MKKKIYVCPKCGRGLNFSDNPEYTFQCLECDEDFYSFEAKEVEQPRMEGIKDYTDVAEAAVKVKEITEKAIQESNKQIEIKSKDVLGQILEYISETIKPVLNAGLYEEFNFIDHVAIYSSNFQLGFGKYYPDRKEFQAQLFGRNGNLRVYFSTTDGYYVENEVDGVVPYLVQEWPRLKDSMNRMIPYAIDEYNKANQRKLEKQREKEQIINSFRL